VKINENLIRQQTEAAKVAATEREKKKTQDAAPLVTLEKKVVSKRKNPDGGEKDKESVSEASRQATTKPQPKKQKVDKISEAEEYADACQTPQIEPSTFYPPRAPDPEKPKDPSIEIEVDPVEAAATAAHSEQMRLYFSSTNPPCEWLKQTPKEEARGKRYFEHYEKTGQFLITGPVPTTRVAGLMDVIGEDEELSYLDDGVPAKASQEKNLALKTIENVFEPAADEGGNSCLQAHEPIDLGSLRLKRWGQISLGHYP
jgi:hypothetical protein